MKLLNFKLFYIVNFFGRSLITFSLILFSDFEEFYLEKFVENKIFKADKTILQIRENSLPFLRFKITLNLCDNFLRSHVQRTLRLLYFLG